jgi:hypothetical protein
MLLSEPWLLALPAVVDRGGFPHEALSWPWHHPWAIEGRSVSKTTANRSQN